MGVQHLTPWKPGQSGNPAGVPKLPEELRGIRALSHVEVCRLISKYARMKPSEIESCLKANKVPILEIAIARILQESAAKGDYTRLAFLLDRAIGKIPVVNPTDEESEALRDIQNLSDKELLRLVKEKIPELEK